ncbi:metal ABC transporter ATP-binding protein [Gordonia sp. HY285]|uniref:Metal ABC transporter ATP-binding protein n=1 Tax=Gordonia liuliyuniae TaxID=2911517 RepID=A0ABS9IVW6_9ACTN|nr:metal ABC transporter ATP-binding protein [Gordonia liuliyuniae]MCF8589630.1 metal ABC transporter ATP-binding protein [Gordonia liuliyuniae]MCF8611952.1 metal ABC transporter ATP-binding protein [Gordonia liuliyuniae]
MSEAVLRFTGSGLSFDTRTLWRDLDLDVAPGEFIAVLGPNGSGKTTLLRSVLGQVALTEGDVTANGRIGYIPQQHADDSDTMMLRGRDLVGFGADGGSWGMGLRGLRSRRTRVDAALAEVDATRYANTAVGLLSGGEQQRLRIAQALTRDPSILLCDEPLASLDLTSQQVVVDLLDARRRRARTAVLFVTHELNPVLPFVDRVLYLADGRFRIGTVDEVMNSAALSDLYGSPIEVVRIGGRLVVVGGEDSHHCVEHGYADEAAS